MLPIFKVIRERVASGYDRPLTKQSNKTSSSKSNPGRNYGDQGTTMNASFRRLRDHTSHDRLKTSLEADEIELWQGNTENGNPIGHA